jgi:UDP-2,3-diacylglucosamine pyrophosphatase LpxH
LTRTLVISDMHIGSRSHPSALQLKRPMELLLQALPNFDRLVLLGDAVELREIRQPQAMAGAEGPMRAIGRAMSPSQQVILVPGNHDRILIADWIKAQGAGLAVDGLVPNDASPLLAELTRWLGSGGATVEVRYPGVRLSDTVWATHGHYLDRHLVPVSPYGLRRRGRRALPRGRAVPADYERTRRVEVSSSFRWLPGPLANLLEDLFELARAATMPQWKTRVLHPRLAPMTAMLLGAQMRRHSLPALAEVLHRLGVQSDYVVFGHVHRLGPLATEDASEWTGPGGVPRFVNTGTWRHEPLLLHGVQAPHPYWPGGAVVIEDDAVPQAIGLLDSLSSSEVS